MKATTSPPIPRSCAVRPVTRPDDVDRIATPIPPSTRGRGAPCAGAPRRPPWRQAVLARVDPAARLGDALQARDDPLAIPAELEVDDQGIEGLALLDVIVP